MNANKWARARIRVTIDGCDWLRYEDELPETYGGDTCGR